MTALGGKLIVLTGCYRPIAVIEAAKQRQLRRQASVRGGFCRQEVNTRRTLDFPVWIAVMLAGWNPTLDYFVSPVLSASKAPSGYKLGLQSSLTAPECTHYFK